MERDRLNAAILSLAEKAWNVEGRPLLLSQLGHFSDGQISRAARTYSNSLSSYIDSELTGRVRKVRHSANHVIVGIVPVNAQTDSISDFDELLEKRIDRSEDASSRIRLHPNFWAAFRKDLDPGKGRFLLREDYLRFTDIPIEMSEPQNSTKIDKSFIASQTDSDAKVYENAERWCAEFGLDVHEFSHSSVSRKHKALDPYGAQRSLLSQLMVALEPEDLRRVSLPMDIVAKLDRKRIQ